MMQSFRTEGNYRDASRLSSAELRAAITSGEILQSTALAFDTQRQLRFELGGIRGVMPFAQCAEGAGTGAVRDHRGADPGGPGHLLCDRKPGGGRPGPALLPAVPAKAQQMCREEYLDHLVPGDVLPCTVTHIESFGGLPAMWAAASAPCCPSTACR